MHNGIGKVCSKAARDTHRWHWVREDGDQEIDDHKY